jgi:hypothetical protein
LETQRRAKEFGEKVSIDWLESPIHIQIAKIKGIPKKKLLYVIDGIVYMICKDFNRLMATQ